MGNIDRKFKILAVNPVNGKIYTEENAILLCAKDAAVPSALAAYLEECVVLGANREHIESIELLISRVEDYQEKIEWRIPDTVGEEIERCTRQPGDDYVLMRANAVVRGWSYPAPDTPFGDHVWLAYWKAMEAYEMDTSKGRPIPPHISGGGTFPAFP